MSDEVVSLLLNRRDVEHASYFHDKGYRVSDPLTLQIQALNENWVEVLKWMHDRHLDVEMYLYCYRQRGIPGVEALWAAGIKPMQTEYIYISQADDSHVELMWWLRWHGCEVNNARGVQQIAVMNAIAGNRTRMLEFLQWSPSGEKA